MNAGANHILVLSELRGKRERWLLPLFLGLVSSACTILYEGRYDYNDGWRKAEIKRVALFEHLSPYPYKYTYCSRNFTDFSTTGSSWAIVRYRQGIKKRYMAIPVPKSGDFKVEDIVYANVLDCSFELHKRETAGK